MTTMADLERQSERPDTESEDTGDRAAQRGQAPPTAPDAWVLGGGRGEDDLGFMPETSAALLQDSPRGGRLILWIAVAFFAAAFTWAAFAKLDEVTRGVGRVIPSRQVQVVQSLDGGIVSDIDVKEGQIVDEGQVLLRIDSTRFSSSFRESRINYLEHLARAARLRAEAEGTPFVAPPEVEKEYPELVEQEHQLFHAREAELKNSLAIVRQQVTQRKQELAELKVKKDQLERSYRLARKELDITKPLVKEGAVSQVEVLRLERQVNEIKGELDATELAIPKAESKYEESKRKAEETEMSFRNQARAELNQTVAELSRLSETNRALEDRVSRTSVRSPVHGTVKRLSVNTVGGVVQPGADLVEIVPLEDSLVIEAKVSPRDIAFLHPQQRVIVKFTAYDYAIYGGLHGSLEHISADTITDDDGQSYYLVRVRTDKNHLGPDAEPLPIIPGMRANIDIVTGKKTVLDYLLKPVLRATHNAMRER